MKRKLKLVVRRLVDELLKWADLPTYEEMRESINSRVKSDHPYLDDSEWFYRAKSLLRRSL